MSEENKKNDEAELKNEAAKQEGRAAASNSGEAGGSEAKAEETQPVKSSEAGPSAAQASEQPKAAMSDEDREAKVKAAAEARAARAAARAAAAGETPAADGDAPKAESAAAPEGDDREAKVKAAAEARAARAAARAAAGGETTAAAGDAPKAESAAAPEGDDKEAKAKAAAEARAARAAARGKPAADENAAPKEPSPKQPMLDKAVALLKELVGGEAVAESFVNERDGHLPYMVIPPDHWSACALVLRDNDSFRLNYLRNVSGIDMETHLEVAYHLLAIDTKDEYCIKVRTDRNNPSIPSVTPIWATANWNEREIYDLFGIDFPGHPDLRRIMMSDDWVGHPLRKDYEAIDPEV